MEIDKRQNNWSAKFIEYFKAHVQIKLEYFARAYIEKNVCVHPENGVTSNQSEGFNWLMKDLNNWKEGPIDSVVLSFRFLQQYFLGEIMRGKAGVGNFTLRDEHRALQISLTEYRQHNQSVMSYQSIVESIKSSDFCFTDETSTPTDQYSHLSKLAKSKEIISGDRISFVPKMGCFVIMGSTGQLYTVQLFPEEKCSCLIARDCCHILSVKLSLRMNIDMSVPKKSVNLTVLRKNARGRKKPGRKQPRPGDVDYEYPDVSNAKKARTVEDQMNEISVTDVRDQVSETSVTDVRDREPVDQTSVIDVRDQIDRVVIELTDESFGRVDGHVDHGWLWRVKRCNIP